jgi:hypothetical protein
MDFKKIRYNNKFYAVIKLKYKNNKFPLLLDWQDFGAIDKLNKIWKCNKFGFISCHHTDSKGTKEVFMHDLIMMLKQRDEGSKRLKVPIIHINRIGFDNRRENIMYDTVDKELNKNIKKKKRTIKLPISSGINTSQIPTYVWYMKPDETHGERFIVDVGDVSWKTTSSKKLSLKYKLEEAKKYLRDLKKDRPELFEEYSMNGDYTKDGKDLSDSYYDIIHRAGYTHIARHIPEGNTEELLKSKYISKKEKDVMRTMVSTGGQQSNPSNRRRLFNSIPAAAGITSQDLPQYTYYRPAKNDRGDYFIVTGHPDQEGTWQTTSSKYVSTTDKYDELLDYLDDLEGSESDYSSAT